MVECSSSELGRDSAHAAQDLFSRLRVETNTLHRELEAHVQIVRENVSRDDYAQFLIAQLGFHRPFEKRFSEIDGLVARLPDLTRRKKSHLIESDLIALGFERDEVTTLPLCEQLPVMNGVDRALGALYVLEGSTLGAAYIYRHLQNVLSETELGEARFLTCYGADTGRMWKAFRGYVLDAQSALDEGALVETACATFSVIKDWFTRVSSVPTPVRSVHAVR